MLWIFTALAADASDVAIDVRSRARGAVRSQTRGAELRSWDEILRAKPAEVEPGVLRFCADGEGDFEELLELADAAFRYSDGERATAYLDAAEGALLCLREPLHGFKVSKMHLLRAALSTQSNDPEASMAALARARLFSPGLRWDSGFPGDEGQLDAAEQRLYGQLPARIRLTPEGVKWTVDGQNPVAEGPFFPLTAGDHTVQLGEGPLFTFEMRLDSGEARLFAPAGLPAAEVAKWAGDSEHRDALDELLHRLLPDADVVFVVADRHVWEHELGGGEWHDRAKSARHGRWLAGIGGAVTAGGLGLSVAAWSQAMGARALALDAHDDAAFEQQLTAYQGHGSAVLLGEVIAGVGLVAVGTGLALTLGGR